MPMKRSKVPGMDRRRVGRTVRKLRRLAREVHGPGGQERVTVTKDGVVLQLGTEPMRTVVVGARPGEKPTIGVL